MKLKNFYVFTAVILLPFISPLFAYEATDLKNDSLYNATAYIPAQCYTKTEDTQGKVHNPCFTCHQKGISPNFVNDADLQESYDFPKPARQNMWKNLFADHSDAVDAISNEAILTYIKQDNYKNAQAGLLLRNDLEDLSKLSDVNGNGHWDGYKPDAYFQFDEAGFDQAPDGTDTGWRAFAYFPLNGTFWPTNGSGDDVLIRLTNVFRENEKGVYDKEVYRINLAIVQSLVQRQNVEIAETEEVTYGVDLNQNGKLDTARQVVFNWHRGQLELNTMAYVGQAKVALKKGQVHMAPGLYPQGTEFLHSVRYIDTNENGSVQLAPRMKELRYMRKRSWKTYTQLENAVLEEVKEENDFPDRLEQFSGNAEIGLDNKRGWVLQGFIEDKQGALRPQTYEESLFCMGCHTGLGTTTDSTFAFPRKIHNSSFQFGWYHWTQKGLDRTPEPKVILGDDREVFAYSHYLEQNNSGNEFRTNEEVHHKFFDVEDRLKPEMLEKVHGNITELLSPTQARTMQMNKAYRTLVQGQKFIWGRDATVKPVDTVYQKVAEGQETGIKSPVIIKGFVPVK